MKVEWFEKVTNCIICLWFEFHGEWTAFRWISTAWFSASTLEAKYAPFLNLDEGVFVQFQFQVQKFFDSDNLLSGMFIERRTINNKKLILWKKFNPIGSKDTENVLNGRCYVIIECYVIGWLAFRKIFDIIIHHIYYYVIFYHHYVIYPNLLRNILRNTICQIWYVLKRCYNSVSSRI